MNHNLKQPPYSEVAESSVLGSILILKSNYDLVKDIISADDFYELKNQKIFLAIVETVERDHNTPNEINIAEKLAACNSEALISWSVYLSNIEQYYTSSKEVLEFAKIIKENSARRKAINECLDFLNLAYNPNYPIENLRDNISRMDSVIAPQAKELKEFARLSNEMMDFYQRKENNKDFVSTGYRELNRMRFYFSKGHLTIVAARPRMGKSAFAVNCIVNYFNQEVNPLPVLFFSLEMPETENASRIHSIMSSVSGDKLLYNHDGITREEWRPSASWMATGSRRRCGHFRQRRCICMNRTAAIGISRDGPGWLRTTRSAVAVHQAPSITTRLRPARLAS